jgi:hypothetical protein
MGFRAGGFRRQPYFFLDIAGWKSSGAPVMIRALGLRLGYSLSGFPQDELQFLSGTNGRAAGEPRTHHSPTRS